MNTGLRIQTLRLLEKMAAAPEEARALGLYDRSRFRSREPLSHELPNEPRPAAKEPPTDTKEDTK